MADRGPKANKSERHDGKRKVSAVSSDSSKPPLQSPRTNASLSSSPQNTFQIPAIPNQSWMASQPHKVKVAIPRLARQNGIGSAAGSSKAGEKHRVTHACQPCRHRKTKCSGERPVCKHCEDFKITCTYADGKRDRVKKEIGSMAGRLEEYEKLLRDLSLRVEDSDHVLIQKALQKDDGSEEGEDVLSGESSMRPSLGRLKSGDGESQASGGAGSTGSLDQTEEDYNRNPSSRATGFIGKNSELSWMHRLREKVDKGDREDGEGPPPDSQGTWTQDGEFLYPGPGSQSWHFEVDEGVTESTFYCDDIALLSPEQVALRELPPAHITEVLLNTYMEIVHPVFPIVGKITFKGQVQKFLENDQHTPGDSWMAILNLILAIAAKYSHLVQADWRGDERDHMIYFTRARMFAMNGDSIFEHADLQRIQVTGLMAFYLLATNQINRSWTMCGIAIRSSIALGLHLRNEAKKMSNTSKEIRYRVWWALYGLERHLGVVTGRPSSIDDNQCSTPLPIPYEEEVFFNPSTGINEGEAVERVLRYGSHESSNSSLHSTGRNNKSPASPNTTSQHSADYFKQVQPSLSLYFLYYIQLSQITHNVLSTIYSPKTMKQSWAHVQQLISVHDSHLERWHANLPPVFNSTKKQRDQLFSRQRMSLGFFYYSTKMLINRPCLCRVDRSIPNESDRSRDMNRAAATTCVRAAKDMLNLLPDEPNPVGLYNLAPWWCTLHYLRTGATVLMLELSLRADHMPYEAEEILNLARKAVYWLHQMARDSIAARRAWKISDEMLRKLAPKIGRDVNDLPSETSPSRTHGHSRNNSRAALADGISPNRDEAASQNFANQFPNRSYYGGPPSEQGNLFLPTVSTSFDQFEPYQMMDIISPVTQTDMRNMFPTSMQISSMAMDTGDLSAHSGTLPLPHWDQMRYGE